MAEFPQQTGSLRVPGVEHLPGGGSTGGDGGEKIQEQTVGRRIVFGASGEIHLAEENRAVSAAPLEKRSVLQIESACENGEEISPLGFFDQHAGGDAPVPVPPDPLILKTVPECQGDPFPVSVEIGGGQSGLSAPVFQEIRVQAPEKGVGGRDGEDLPETDLIDTESETGQTFGALFHHENGQSVPERGVGGKMDAHVIQGLPSDHKHRFFRSGKVPEEGTVRQLPFSDGAEGEIQALQLPGGFSRGIEDEKIGIRFLRSGEKMDRESVVLNEMLRFCAEGEIPAFESEFGAEFVASRLERVRKTEADRDILPFPGRNRDGKLLRPVCAGESETTFDHAVAPGVIQQHAAFFQCRSPG